MIDRSGLSALCTVLCLLLHPVICVGAVPEAGANGVPKAPEQCIKEAVGVPANPTAEDPDPVEMLGIKVAPVPEVLALHLPSLLSAGQGHGLLVTEVIVASPAARCLNKGDILHSVDAVPILGGREELSKRLCAKASQSQFTLGLIHRGVFSYCEVELPTATQAKKLASPSQAAPQLPPPAERKPGETCPRVSARTAVVNTPEAKIVIVSIGERYDVRVVANGTEHRFTGDRSIVHQMQALSESLREKIENILRDQDQDPFAASVRAGQPCLGSQLPGAQSGRPAANE